MKNKLLFLFFILVVLKSGVVDNGCAFALTTHFTNEYQLLAEDTPFVANSNKIPVNTEDGISYYPNPIKDVFNLDLSKSKVKYHTVILTNVFGKEMAKEDISALPPSKQSLLQIQTQNLPSGMYFVTLMGPDNRKTFRISKEN